MATLYRYFDADGLLLYVGISANPLIRMENHRDGAPWWHLARSATFERYATRREAMDAESAAIRQEKPRFNETHIERQADVVITADPEARYDCQKIADLFRHHIAAGDVAACASLPSIAKMSELFRVSHPTVRKAMKILSSESLVCGYPTGYIIRAGWEIRDGELVRPGQEDHPD